MQIKRLLVLSTLVAGSAHAEYWDGNILHQRLNGVQGERAIALGYVIGVSDALLGVTHCTPANVTAGQIQDMVRNFLHDHPAIRHFSGDSIVSRVLKAAWPCPERNNGRQL